MNSLWKVIYCTYDLSNIFTSFIFLFLLCISSCLFVVDLFGFFLGGDIQETCFMLMSSCRLMACAFETVQNCIVAFNQSV